MTHIISPDRSKLTIRVTPEEQAELRELGEAIHQDSVMADFLEPITCNSELEWIPEGTTGDLTSAPMLGITGEQDRESYSDTQDRKNYTPSVLERWCFADYQVRSVLQNLMEYGEVVFVDRF